MAIKHLGQRFTRLTGTRQEQRACLYLQHQGLVLLQSNYLCKLGEIDLIMTEASQFLIFVEVRYRRQHAFGDAVATVDHRKQRKIRLAAAHFLTTHPRLSHFACRFDVVGVSLSNCQGEMHFDWIRDAFM